MSIHNYTVTGVASGTTTVVANSTSDPTKTANVTINVIDGDVTTSSVGDIVEGETATITANLGGDLVGLSGVTATFAITSADNDDEFVTITSSGLVGTLTGAIAGSGGRVGVTIDYQGLIWTDDSRVNVVAPPVVVTATSGDATVAAGSTIDLSSEFSATPASAQTAGFTYSIPTAQQEFATVDATTGVVTGVAAGSATVTATSIADDTKSATKVVNVT